MNKTAEKQERLNLWLERLLAQQKDRLVLWMPVALACGIGAYFSLRAEPDMTVTGLALLAALGFLSGALRWRDGDAARRVLWLAVCAAFLSVAGFAAAHWRTVSLSTVMLEKELKVTRIAGTVRAMDMLEPGAGMRFILEDLEVEDLPPEKTPQRVRLKVRGHEGIKAGDRISVLGSISPPSAPVSPHAFDFQRYAYFSQIGAFGYTYEAPQLVPQEEGKAPSWRLFIESLRGQIEARIREKVSFPEAAVIMALITGEMTAVSTTDWESMRVSGLAHMLSISGLHVGLVAGVFFFCTRFLMVIIPGFALHHPVKKYAAIIAFAGTLFYTFLAGAPIPTIRSMIMTGIVLFAVVVDRVAFSTRLVALAAFCVLLLWPEALWGASFQMSFGAVAAMIVCYEAFSARLAQWHKDAGWFRRAFLYVAGIAATTIIASLATAPFSLYHFQQLGVYGLPANVAAGPVMGFIIMPAAVLACLLMPLGLEGPALWVMKKGVAFILAISHYFSSLPHASLHIYALPFSVLILTVTGALVLLLWRGPGKVACVALFCAALTIALTYKPPDILVSSSGKLAAVRDAAGRLHVSSLSFDRFTTDNWMQRNAQEGEEPLKWPTEGIDAEVGLSCDESGCRLVKDGRIAAFSFHPVTQAEDCREANIVIALTPMTQTKCAARPVIDFYDMKDRGAHAVWMDGRYESVGEIRGSRPWTVSNGR